MLESGGLLRAGAGTTCGHYTVARQRAWARMQKRLTNVPAASAQAESRFAANSGPASGGSSQQSIS